ncbi:MAG: hypothetical protein ACYDHH_05945 [Solirubrobacteraceae bacterium]
MPPVLPVLPVVPEVPVLPVDPVFPEVPVFPVVPVLPVVPEVPVLPVDPVFPEVPVFPVVPEPPVSVTVTSGCDWSAPSYIVRIPTAPEASAAEVVIVTVSAGSPGYIGEPQPITTVPGTQVLGDPDWVEIVVPAGSLKLNPEIGCPPVAAVFLTTRVV